jgi:hypothetical protein
MVELAAIFQLKSTVMNSLSTNSNPTITKIRSTVRLIWLVERCPELIAFDFSRRPRNGGAFVYDVGYKRS